MQTRRSPNTTLHPADAPANGRKAKRVIYPSSDGKPMAETSVHIAELIRSLLTLEDYFAADTRVWVAADMFVYYEKGNPRASVAPDLFVVKGVPKRHRDNYKIWEEGAVPAFVLELTSASTALDDQRKREVYGRIGVPEYVLYDPRPEEQLPRRTVASGVLQGYRQGASGNEPIPLEADGGLVSRELGLRLVVAGDRLAWYDGSTGVRLLDPRERVVLAEEHAALADVRVAEAERRAEAAEAHLAELEALLREDRPPDECD